MSLNHQTKYLIW